VEYVIALVTLAAMEIVLGIDNIVVIAILTSRLPPAQQPSARKLGLALALVMRILLLCSLQYIMKLTYPIFEIGPILDFLHISGFDLGKEANEISIKDLILLGGGLFLIAKSVHEIHNKIEGEHESGKAPKKVSYGGVLFQIALLDIIFSLDSVITAVGMANNLWIMIAAVILAVGVMMIFAEPVSRFVEKHPTIKILALSFLILIGVMLTAEGLGKHIEKGYIYFAMAFSLVVEIINMRVRARSKSVVPHKA
jgi:predicted tellurium resistance membrane protein TerC